MMITYYTGQYRDVCGIFYSAIHRTASQFYSLEQVQAWAPEPRNYDRWQWRCELKRPFLYMINNEVAGFIELDHDGHIDCHYTRPEFNRRGVGSALLEHVIAIAEALGMPRLYVEASHVAKGLYLKHGFVVIRPNEVIRRGVAIQNWIMERPL